MSRANDKLYEEMQRLQGEEFLKYVGKKSEESASDQWDKILDMELPPSLDNKLKELIVQQSKNSKAKRRKRDSKSILRKCATIVLAIIITGTLVIATVDAVRIKVIDLIFEEHSDHIEIIPKTLEDENSLCIPLDWSGYWYPEYVPDGYSLMETNAVGTQKEIVLSDMDNRFLFFEQSNAESGTMGVNNEHSDSGEVDINGITARWFENGGKLLLVWLQQDTLFTLYGQIDLEELASVAQSISYRK